MNIFKRILNNLNYKLLFLKVLNSPFKGLKLRFYFGEIKMGTPYFYPRKWVKDKEEKGHLKAVYIKYFHFHFHTLGWKTKWDEYRFEYNPGISIVIFGKQLMITILPNTDDDVYDQFWEAWLTYNNETDKKLSKKERLSQLIKKHSCTWISYGKNGDKTKTDYYNLILKKKYLKYYNQIIWEKG